MDGAADALRENADVREFTSAFQQRSQELPGR